MTVRVNADTVDQSLALIRIRTERRSQDSKWGSQRRLPDDTWLRILMEEVGEVAEVLNDGEGLERLDEELSQVAAVAVAWIEAVIVRVADIHRAARRRMFGCTEDPCKDHG